MNKTFIVDVIDYWIDLMKQKKLVLTGNRTQANKIIIFFFFYWNNSIDKIDQ